MVTVPDSVTSVVRSVNLVLFWIAAFQSWPISRLGTGI
jgi:hypothetical protein